MNASPHCRRIVRWGLALLLLGQVLLAHAQTRAWLDRNTIVEGGTVTLNIETAQTGATPDYTPLRADFELSAATSSRQVQWENGAMASRALFGIALTPRRSGVIQIPSLRVGREQTTPLTLQVQAGQAAAPAARGDEVAFIETDIGDATPYVQQTVGVVVRLYYATQLASGELVLDTPAGASLQRVGDDRSLVREVGGRRYNVVERRFLLIPERSGPLVLEGARFTGRGVGGMFNDFFGSGTARLSARAPTRTLQVQPQPDNAPQPWLPLHDLRLRYTATPQAARVGEAAALVIEAVADGATRTQFPELPVPSLGDAAQVFAEPPQYDETFDGSVPRLKMTRRYSIVPQREGRLQLADIGMDWWDVASGRARRTLLPPITLEVSGGQPALVAPPLPVPAVDPSATNGPDKRGDALAATVETGREPWPWITLAVLFALLWLLTLAWALRRRRAAAVEEPPVTLPAAGSNVGLADLRRALERDGLDEVERILCTMAGVDSIDAVIEKLADPVQRQALSQLQRARWAGQGDVAAARQALRQAMKPGPRWHPTPSAGKTELPPLYPSAGSG